ncbi:hypothetical protein CHU00_12365 [Sphingobacterium cellulitidis]|uniref:agmatine deiminase family protein n=1 Tax=Sphingobacterium cellulitidis TaxID=1768011 RepID=UPI000B945442|nr:agmatine deiminase family protein [Sphingobacterium cellulitidis]OYD45432.1 hypothetical protein CHU00_12365 [Sphingobacterium cellulitidis]
MIFVSSLLKDKYSSIFNDLKKNVQVKEIPNTKDIWIRDFMPIWSNNNSWVLFQYFPKYLRNPKFQNLISDNRSICNQLGIDYQYSEIILDGGSVVYFKDIFLVSDRIYQDNPSLSKQQIRTSLENLFHSDKIIIVPAIDHDFTGHLDGILTIIDSNLVLINDFQEEEYKNQLIKLISPIFDIEFLPYNPYKNRTYQSAKGVYMNFIETTDFVLVPVFKQIEDELAIDKLNALYSKKTIVPINCNELAIEGGLLHCISWSSYPSLTCKESKNSVIK